MSRILREWGKHFEFSEVSRYQIMTSRKFMYKNKNVFTFVSILFRALVKSALLQNVCTFVIRCVLPTLFTHKYRGQIMGGLV